MEWHLSWIGTDGKEWPLNGPGVRGVFVEEGGTVGALVGEVEDAAVSLVSPVPRRRAGQQLEARSADLQLVVASSTSWGEHGSKVDVFREFCRGLSATEPGWLRLSFDSGAVQWLACTVGPVEGLSRPTKTRDVERFRFPIRHFGLWEQRMFRRGPKVLVSNFGELPVWPEIVWQGAGGTVTLPSGAVFTLPPVAGRRRLCLDPAATGAVFDKDGKFDRSTWLGFDGAVFGEQTPPGGTAVYEIPAGAELVWNIYRRNPWKGM